MESKDTKRGRGNTPTTSTVNELKEVASISEAAEKLLNNTTLNKALTSMKENAIKSLLETEVNDRDTRESIHYLLKVIDSFKQELATYVNKGATANLKLRTRK